MKGENYQSVNTKGKGSTLNMLKTEISKQMMHSAWSALSSGERMERNGNVGHAMPIMPRMGTHWFFLMLARVNISGNNLFHTCDNCVNN